MANTYTSLLYHVVFSTKSRLRLIRSDLEPRLWQYLGGIAKKHGFSALQVGGIEDHIHALVLAPARLSPSQMAQYLKGDSSLWIHKELRRKFAWQDGYGAFTVGPSSVPEVIHYIQRQHEHHKKRTFEEEYIDLLRTHGIAYNERYLWG